MSTHVCLDNVNPYFKNPNAREILPTSQVSHEGRLYTKHSYDVSYLNPVKIAFLRRVIQIISVLMLTIISLSFALLSKPIRKLMDDGIEGFEYFPAQKTEHVLMPYQDIFETKDVGMTIASDLPLKSILAMRQTSASFRYIAEKTLVNKFNAGECSLKIACGGGNDPLARFSKFFGENCSSISRLEFHDRGIYAGEYMQKIAEKFPMLKELVIFECYELPSFEVALFNFFLGKHIQIGNKSFMQHCQQLTRLDFENWNIQIKDIGFLEHCPKLKELNFSRCGQIADFSLLKHCTDLTKLNLEKCIQINDLSFLEYCPKLTDLNLSGCTQIVDFSPLRNCPNLSCLKMYGCPQLENISFSNNFLSLGGRTHIRDFSFLRYLPSLTGLDLSRCTQIDDFSFLELCSNLKQLNLSECTQINVFNFLRFCPKLEELNLSMCTQIDFSFLRLCPNLKKLDLTRCTQTNFNFLRLYPNLVCHGLPRPSAPSGIQQNQRVDQTPSYEEQFGIQNVVHVHSSLDPDADLYLGAII